MKPLKIEHIGVWTRDLEKMKEFYVDNFGLICNEKYYNPIKKFSSYFLQFPSGPRIELMHRPDIANPATDGMELFGLAHLAISVGSEQSVGELTEKLRAQGLRIVGEPRRTGDGYYESVVADPEGNLLEITV